MKLNIAFSLIILSLVILFIYGIKRNNNFINIFKIVTDHLWFDLTKGFESADLLPGDVVEFCARVSIYEKGYKGYRNGQEMMRMESGGMELPV